MPDLAAKFYYNMGVQNVVIGVQYITSMINGRPIFLDHMLLGKALKFHLLAIGQTPLDISKIFVFNFEEKRLSLSVFYGDDVPNTVFESTNGRNYEHFIPLFENLAQIIKANYFPSSNTGKLMSFVELKLMYKLVSQRIDFNLAYMILPKMILQQNMGLCLMVHC